MRELIESERIIHGRESRKTTIIIIDSKSVKNTDTAEEKGFDVGKNVSCKITYSGRYSRIISRKNFANSFKNLIAA